MRPFGRKKKKNAAKDLVHTACEVKLTLMVLRKGLTLQNKELEAQESDTTEA